MKPLSFVVGKIISSAPRYSHSSPPTFRNATLPRNWNLKHGMELRQSINQWTPKQGDYPESMCAGLPKCRKDILKVIANGVMRIENEKNWSWLSLRWKRPGEEE